MSFSFDGGDILVILLVTAALVLSRRFDRTGRSLEKVRRYADKSKADLDAIVAQRELALRDLAVDLEVQEKTNREILARAEAARGEIVARTEDLEERVERIEAHERALEELNELALRVDENLSRLKAESAYVDEVGSRLSEVKKGFAELADKDRARFESFREEAVGRLGSDIEAMRAGLEEGGRQLVIFQENLELLNAEHSDEVGRRLSGFRDELERVEEEFRSRLADAAEQGARLEHDAFTALKLDIEARTGRLEENWTGGMNDLKNEVAGTAEEIREVLAETRRKMELADGDFREMEQRVQQSVDRMKASVDGDRGEMERRIQETSAGLQGGMAELEAGLDGLKSRSRERISEHLNRFEAEFGADIQGREAAMKTAVEELGIRIDRFVETRETELLESVGKRQSEYRQSIEEGFGRIEEFMRDMDALTADLESSRKRILTDAEHAFEAFDKEMAEKRTLEQAREEEEAARLRREMTELETALEELKLRARAGASEALGKFEDEFFTDLRRREDEIRGAMEQQRRRLEAETNAMELKAAGEREEAEGRWASQLNQRFAELQSRASGEFEAFREQLDGFRDSLSGRMNKAEEDFSGVHEGLSRRISEAGEHLNRFEAEFSADIQGRDAAMKAALEDLRIRVDRFVENRETDLLESVEKRQSEYRRAIEERFGRIEEFMTDMDTLAAGLQSSQKQTLADVRSAFTAFDEEMTERRALEQARGEEEAARLRGDMTELEAALEELNLRARGSASETLRKFEDEFLTDLKRRDDEIRGVMEEQRRNWEAETKAMELRAAGEREEAERRCASELNQRFVELQSRASGEFEAFRDSLSGRIGKAEEDFSGFHEGLSRRIAESGEQLNRFQADFSADIEGRDSAMKAAVEELRIRVDQFVEDKEINLLESVEKRQSEYRKSIEDRFGRIEEFIEDMDTLAAGLQSSQKQTLTDVQNAFTAFDEEMTERRALERARDDEDAARLRCEMTELEKSLDELKLRAADNISDKLQVFEDEFFADLKRRGDEMHQAVEEWRKTVELETGELGVKAVRERDEVERRCSSELKQRLGEIQSRVFSQFEALQDQVDTFRGSLSGRILTAEEEFSGFHEGLSDRIAKEKESSGREFQHAFEVFEKETDEKLTKAGKTIAQRLEGFNREIEERRKEITGEFTVVQDEARDWKERIAARIAEGERSTLDSMEGMKSDFAAVQSEMRDEYSGRTEELVIEWGEERQNLRRSLAEMEDSVNRLATQLTEQRRDAVEALKEQGENFLLDFRRNSREAREEVERKVKDLRQSVNDSRERAEAARKEMSAHTDNEYARLMRNLDEIDKRQREFIAETRVFERADEIKEGLEADITELKAQLEIVGAGREEIRMVNERYERSLSLYEDVSAKIARFLSEQQKVDNLEGKIARIGSLSESVDLKLDRVTDANDSLQEIQVRLKQLEDLHEDLDARYGRLSEKSTVLDAASDGVDKNFERMTKMEMIIKNIAERLIPVRSQMEEAEERLLRLDEEKPKIDSVVEKVSSLDSTITEVDRRLDELGRAREWVARTETRMEELNTEIQNHIRLLGTLSERDGRKSAGSPDISTREMVVKLARLGWNSEEIARTAKLSRSEVELILEITPKE